MKLITISGLDGSGKSTQIELLKRHFEQQGKRVFYFHAVSFSIANKLSGRGNSATPGENKSVTKASPLTICLRKVFLLIDLIRFRFFYQKAQRYYDYILSDRFFYDQIVNIFYLSNRLLPSRQPLWLKLAHLLLIQPDTCLYLTVSPAQIMQRQRAIDQGLPYLQKKESLYKEFFALKPYSFIIDGHPTKEQIFDNILAKIV